VTRVSEKSLACFNSGYFTRGILKPTNEINIYPANVAAIEVNPKTIAQDFLSGIIVFLVALPLCLGIAIASDADPMAGLISGIVGGIVIGIFSGSHTSVSGPAAGLTAIVAAQIAKLETYETFLLAVVLAGVIQVGFGLMKAGALSAFFPSSVIKGLLAAIGVILIFKQLPLLFGHYKDMGTPSGVTRPVGEIIFGFFKAIKELFYFENGFQYGAITVGLFSLAFLYIWDQIPKLKKSLVPSPLLVVILGSLLGGLVSKFGGNWTLAAQQLVNVPSADSLGGFASLLRFPDFSQLTNANVYVGALTIAIVASLETLLNLDAVDKLDRRQRVSPPNRELFAQGLGNVTAGMLGGIPVTSVVIRGSVNVGAGAQTKMSAIFHGVLLVGCVLLIPHVLRMIPLSCLAAILLMTGFKLASATLFKKMASEGRYQFLPFIFTLVAIVLTDLLIGIGIGMVLSLLFILNSNLRRPVRKIMEKHIDGDLLHIELGDQVTFLNKASLEGALREASQGSRLLVDARRTDYIDPDVLSLIREFKEKTAPAFDIAMQLIGFREIYEMSDKEDAVDFSILEAREKLTPTQVLEILKSGNKRFVEGHPLDRSLIKPRVPSNDSSSAIAVIVSGIDSQTPVEMIFDLGIGEAFVIRTPGAVQGPPAVGGVEYCVSVGGAKLVVVMGHADSSLLSLAIQNAGSAENKAQLAGCASLEGVLQEIAVSIDPHQARSFPKMSPPEKLDYLNQLARRHVTRMADTLVKQSDALSRLIATGQVQVVTAMFDPADGSVQFLSD
jgi:carbonic anhydrase